MTYHLTIYAIISYAYEQENQQTNDDVLDYRHCQWQCAWIMNLKLYGTSRALYNLKEREEKFNLFQLEGQIFESLENNHWLAKTR